MASEGLEAVVVQVQSKGVVRTRDQTVVSREHNTTVINRGSPGIQGIQGPVGPRPEFAFSSPSPTGPWIINHNLGFEPDVIVKDLGGNVVQAQLLHTSLNQVITYFNVPQAGTARCE